MNSVNTNVGAMIALQSLNSTNSDLFTVQNRVNTGRKINTSKDNAAIWAIAQNQRGEVASYNAVRESLQRGQSAIDVALSAGEGVSDLLNKMKQLALSASDKNLDGSSRKAIETEYNSLARQINSTIQNASFNGVNLLDGTTILYKALANSKGTASIDVGGENLTLRTTAATAASAVTTAVDLSGGYTTGAPVSFTVDADDAGAGAATTINIAAGSYTADQMVELINNQLKAAGGNNGRITVELVAGAGAGSKVLRFNSTFIGTTSDIGVGALAGVTGGAALSSATAGTVAAGGGGILEVQGNVSWDSNTNYALLIQQLDSSIANVSSAVGRLGSGSKSMEGTLGFVSKLQDTIEAGIGNLVDADLAKESARLQALQTKQQLGVQALSIANQSSGMLLSLFRQ